MLSMLKEIQGLKKQVKFVGCQAGFGGRERGI
jgi:hypothetical protein